MNTYVTLLAKTTGKPEQNVIYAGSSEVAAKDSVKKYRMAKNVAFYIQVWSNGELCQFIDI
jgi:hypothetical protein